MNITFTSSILKFLWFWALMTFTSFVVVAVIWLALNPVAAWLLGGHWHWSVTEMTIRYLLSSFSLGLIVAVPMTCNHWYVLGSESKVVKWVVIVIVNAAALGLIFGVMTPCIKFLSKWLVSL